MNSNDFNNSTDLAYSDQLKELRNLSKQFLQHAIAGVPRAEYLKKVANIMKNWVDCDIIRIVLFDTNRKFFCEQEGGNKNGFRFEVNMLNGSDSPPQSWRYSSAAALEKLCRDIIEMRVDSSKPWITAFGSFRAENLDMVPDIILPRNECLNCQGLRLSEISRSLVLVPVDGASGRLGIIQMESQKPGCFSLHQIGLIERLVQTFGLAINWRNLQVALRERVKELSCLYGIARLVAQPETSLDVVLQNAVNLLPPAWLFPEAAVAKIIFEDHIYATPGFDRMVQSIKADIIIGDVKRGKVEVGYTVEKPPIDEGPFLVEERNLIDTIANELASIIEQKLYNEEKQKLQSQLRRADRLATIGQLAAGVAHELNEPLANILGFAQLAIKGPDLADQTQKDLSRIVSATLHAREIIKDLLTFARESDTVRVSFNLNDLIKDGLFFLESRFTKAGINLDCELSPGLPEIIADRSNMLQVITNLVVNSVQAMPDGGKLKIKTVHKNGSLYLTVKDTGIGVDTKILNQIFNPFFTTKDVNEGTGLGLSVVHGIVSSHGGEIEVESHKNRGTKFTIRLPLQPPNHEEDDGGLEK